MSLGVYSRIFSSFSWFIFGQVTHLDQSRTRKQKYLMDYILKYQSSHFSLNQLPQKRFFIVVVVIVIIIIWLFSEPYSFFFQLSFCKKSIDHPFISYFIFLSQDKKRTQHQPQHQLCETLNWHFHTR